MTTFQEHNYTNTSTRYIPVINGNINTNLRVSSKNLQHILQLKSFTNLNQNWDSYNATVPNVNAISKAIEHILWLNANNIEVYFTAPTRDGDILIEVKSNNASLEFIFSGEVSDKICLMHNETLVEEYTYYNSNAASYLKWLICPNGNCPDFR
jgi:hypothetical protein